MYPAFSHLKKYLLFTALLFCFYTAGAQVNYNAISFRIDSLAAVGLPKSALKQVDELDNLARKNNNAAQQVRAAIYRMTFQSYLEENALESIINRLKIDINKAEYPVKPVLQSLLGQMYWNYFEQNRYQFSQRTRQEKPDSDFTSWDVQTIVTETARLYDLSLTDAAKEQNTPISVLDGVLEGDSANRYLRPTLYDLLVQRAFDFFLTDEAGLIKPKLPFSLNDARFFGDNQTFANLVVKTTDTGSTEYKGVTYLQQATQFHLQHGDKEALADLDMQRLRFLYGRSKVEHKDSLYVSALGQIAKTFASKPISSEALVLEGQYYQGIDSLVIAHGFFTKAAAAYPQSLGGENATNLIKQIEEKELSATVEDVNVPGKPILGLFEYKNVSDTRVFIYKLSGNQLIKYNGQYSLKKYSAIKNYQNARQKAKLEFLEELKPIRIDTFKLVDAGDYRNHSLEFKLNALEAGNYVLLVKDRATVDTALMSLTDFRVSRLAYTSRINPDNNAELLVADRETGETLTGVKVVMTGSFLRYDKNKNSTIKIDTMEYGFTNRDGLFKPKEILSRDASIVFSLSGDTLTENAKYQGAIDQSDDEPEDKTVFFTDRQIYRPGQTIYFKAIQLQTVNGKSKIVSNKKLEIEFVDVNGKQVSLARLTTNEFGTVSGSFIIPQTLLAGDVTLRTDDGQIEVKVEEYKRPTFQVEFLPVKESYKLNDSVTIKGNVTAFSGYGLSQAKVAYHIVRSQNRPYYNYKYRRGAYQPNYSNEAVAEIKTDTITTDDRGHFQIKFKAIPGNSNNENYNYAINADVTDESGETHSGETTVIIGNKDIKIDIYIPDQLFAKDSLKGPIKITNLNGQAEKGNIKVDIYALKKPERIFKNRLWQDPDQFLINKADFKNDFPEYAYANEDLVSSWPTLKSIFNSTIALDTVNPGMIDLKALSQHPSGMYKIIMSARNEKGDTTSVTKYVNLIGERPGPLKFGDWVTPVLNYVKPGDTASFLVGIDQKVNVLMERYSGAKLISSKWLHIDKGQQKIEIPITSKDKDDAIQFMMIFQNRMYASYQKIYLSNMDKALKIKLLTFRNKLQPGEKDQWKLQISSPNNEKQTAEMVADLYDASLDDITPPQNWQDALTPEYSGQPNYFAWLVYDFISANSTTPINYRHTNYNLLSRTYERLNMFGYNYYGGYNNGYQNYLQLVKENERIVDFDKQLEKDYEKNAALIKNGYLITGKVIDVNDKAGIMGVVVSIKGTKIKTTTNSTGNFKMRVPVNGVLKFAYAGYDTQEISTDKKDNLTIRLKSNTINLREVTITGYTTQMKKDLTGAVTTITLRGNRSASVSNDSVQEVADGLTGKVSGLAVYSLDNGVNPNVSIVLRGNSSNSNGSKPIALRTNFAETAFFYPQLHTDEKGQILIDFTIPEALTRWKLRALAHTKDLSTGYLESEVVTQKQLSISANKPRFLREGDTITISARLANLTAGKLKGKVQLHLFNALNMQPVNLFLNKADAEQAFEVDGSTNKAVSFRLVIPSGLDALDYKLTADASEFTDGEENTLPVLPNRTLVTESMPMMVRAGQTKDFTFDSFVNQNSPTLKNKTFTLEYTSNPAWYAVQALPYMMEFPYECSEQVFSRYFANSLATDIVNKNPVIKKVFDQWKNTNSAELLSNLEKNQELKSTLVEETPWLRDATSESEQKKRIALLFDLNKMSDELKQALDKLQKRQLPDGSFTWFGGDRGDRYITQHIAEGMGELHHLHIGDDLPDLQQIAGKAIDYLDSELLHDEKLRKKDKDNQWYYGDIEIHAWFTRSYFLDKPMNKDLKAALANYLKWAGEQWTSHNAYEQGMIALTLQRYKKADITTQIERSLLETAQQSDELGMYWAKNQLGYYWYESPVETQSLLIELFSEAGDNAKAVDEMKIWLLRNKQTNNWQTTKATAAACYALLLKGSNLLADTGATSIKLNGKPLNDLKPDVKADAGTGYIKTSWADEQIKPELGKVEIKNNGKIVSWGALHWQYFENLDKITSSNTNIHLQRKYFIQTQTDAGPVLTAVDATHQPKTGDLLKVVVNLKADRDFEYVQLKDMRPAGTEPVDALSTYKYQDGLYYYQVTKDVATNFFISELGKGSYVFEYRLRVAQPGNFSTGITSIQCMYAPEFNAHSEGSRMAVRP